MAASICLFIFLFAFSIMCLGIGKALFKTAFWPYLIYVILINAFAFYLFVVPYLFGC